MFYSLRSQLVIKMMLASAKIDLPIQNELGFSLPVDLDSEVAPKGIGLVSCVPDRRQGQDPNLVQALKEIFQVGRALHSSTFLHRAIAVAVTLIQ